MLIEMPLLLVATVTFLRSRRCGEIEGELAARAPSPSRVKTDSCITISRSVPSNITPPTAEYSPSVFSRTIIIVDVAGLAARERRGHAVEQPRGAQVDVLVEFAAELQQRPPQRDVIGHRGRPADRAEVDRIGAFELRLPVVGHHLAVLRVVVAARPLDVLVFESRCRSAC